MTAFLLIRHGHTERVGKALAGRRPGVALTVRGRAQAAALARRLETFAIQRIYSSPLQRARETAEPLARRLGMALQVAAPLNEVAFGAWEGRTLTSLVEDAQWQCFNAVRSVTRPPGGELIGEVQARMVGFIEDLRQRHRDETVALVSHGDPIKTVLAHYLGVPLDFVLRFEVAVASVSILQIEDHGPRVHGINLQDDWPRP